MNLPKQTILKECKYIVWLVDRLSYNIYIYLYYEFYVIFYATYTLKELI